MNELAERLNLFWSEAKVCLELDLAVDELRARESNGDILDLPTSDWTPVNLYPVKQFERASTGVRVKPGLAAMFRELRHRDAWTAGRILCDDQRDESGQNRTPV